jgi:arylsulfatase
LGESVNYETTLAGELSKAGYYTQCVGKMHVHLLRSTMGFHNVELHDGTLRYYRSPNIKYAENQKIADDYFYWLKNEKGIECEIMDTGLECNSWVARPWIYEEKYHPTNWVSTRSIDFLRRRDPRKPFFLMSSYVRPHPPFDAPQCYFDMYKNMDLRMPALGDWESSDQLEKRGRIYDAETGPSDPELIRQELIGYYSCITHVDHQIGRIIQELIDNKLYDNTIIIFTSDHGEILSDHHLFKKSRPYQGCVNIPMIISGPQHLIGKCGRVADDLVELRDILPTVLDMAKYEIPNTIEGKSMFAPLCGETFKSREHLHGEHCNDKESNHFIVTKNDKYIWYSQTGVEQYFELINDPREEHNLFSSDSCKSRIDYLRKLLILELTGREEGYTDGGKLIVGATPKNCLNHILVK